MLHYAQKNTGFFLQKNQNVQYIWLNLSPANDFCKLAQTKFKLTEVSLFETF